MTTANESTSNRRPRYFGRYRQIALVLVKYQLGEIARSVGLERFLPFHWIPPSNPWQKQTYSKPVRVRMALEELGTTFVKVGQILSTRTDVLPSEYTRELAKLQDSLKPISFDLVEEVVKEELGKPVAQLFAHFEPEPLGVASIGQAHGAKLEDGTDVVVKVQKPGVFEQVSRDMDILRHLATAASRRATTFQQHDVGAVVEELADTMTGEMDFIREGHSAETFARFFLDDPAVHIPRIYWQYTTSRVITMERITGTNIMDLKSLDKAGFDRKDLARRSVGLWVRMVFENPVFHADPHPGNLFVEADGRLGLVDFGMIGLVDDEVRNNLVNGVRAMLDRDVDLLIDSLLDLGAVAPIGSREELRRDLKHIMSHYPLVNTELRSASNLADLFAVIRRNRVQLPANTFLLLKTMAMAQSLGRGLDNDFDFFSVLAPHVDKVVKDLYRPSRILKRFPRAAAELAVFGAGLPNRLIRIVKSVERGELRIKTDVSGVERHMEHLERMLNRAIIGIIIAAGILALAIAYLATRVGH